MRVEIGLNRGLWAAAAAATLLSAGAPMMAPSLGSYGRSYRRHDHEPTKVLRHVAIAKAKKKAAHKNARKARRRNRK